MCSVLLIQPNAALLLLPKSRPGQQYGIVLCGWATICYRLCSLLGTLLDKTKKKQKHVRKRNLQDPITGCVF